MVPNRSSPVLRREQQVSALSIRMAVLGGLMAALATALMVVGQRGQGELSSFLNGMGTGILAGLPLSFAVMTLRIFRRMDEYARQQLVQATSLAFMLTMLVSGSLLPLQAVLKFSTPSWVFYAVGMGAWLIATLVQNARASRDEG